MAAWPPLVESKNEPFAGETQPSRDDMAMVSGGTSAAAFQYAEDDPCEIFATLCIYLNRVTLPDRFSVSMSPNHNKWGSQTVGRLHASVHVGGAVTSDVRGDCYSGVRRFRSLARGGIWRRSEVDAPAHSA